MESGQNIALFAENEPFRATKMWNELVKNLKSGVRLKKKRWRMKYYEDCFSGSDALAWIYDFLKLNPNFGHNVSRTQAKLLCQKLLQRNVFEDVVVQFKSTKPVFEESHLYSFVSKLSIAKEARVRSITRSIIDAKENANSKCSKVDRVTAKSSLKRHSSFSDRFNLSRKPLGERRALQNISQEVENKDNLKQIRMKPSKPTRSRKKQSLNNDKGGLVLQNLVMPNVKSEQSSVRGRNSGKFMSGLSRKWKSEYDVSLMEKNEESSDEDTGQGISCDRHTGEDISRDRHTEEIVCKGNDELVNQQGASNDNTGTTMDNCQEEFLPKTDPNELWVNVCLERLQQSLNVDTLNDILDVELLSWKNVMDNITSDLRCVTKAVPEWLVSAMKFLIHWPQNTESRAAARDYSGIENDVFKTIQEHFQLLSKSLVSSNFIDVFIKISGLITKCKLSAIRALQLTLLLLEKEQRQQLQLLLRFMIKVSNNHQLNLSGHLPTRELVIQTFVPCIFGGKDGGQVHEILGIRITSFIMDNYTEVFKVPDGLRFEVEQQIAFHKRKENIRQEGIQSNDITFCLRVTKQEYEEQKQLGTQRFLHDLLDSIVRDEKIDEKERRKKLKQFQKTYPEIYLSRYPGDGLSVISQKPAQDRLRRVMKPLTRRHVKDLR